MSQKIDIDNIKLNSSGMTELSVWADKHGAKYDIISKTAYLAGVDKTIFEMDGQPPQMMVYTELEQEKAARIIRNLCILRTAMLKYNQRIYKALTQERKTIIGCGKYIPMDVLQQLDKDGVDVYKHTSVQGTNEFMVYLNSKLKERIGDCRRFFPEWLNWDYAKNILLMPDGTKVNGIKEAAAFYYANNRYDGALPYTIYMNIPAENNGNILYCDQKFVELLYKWNGDKFTDLSLVKDVGCDAKNKVYDFIESSQHCVVIVDCENSDPYNLCAAFKGLEEESLSKIDKVVLFDDINASAAWKMLDRYISIEVERIEIERLKFNKSLADVMVTRRICQEVYKNSVDAIILASSDSDYWGVMDGFDEARFLVLVEHEKCSGALKDVLKEKDIYYCYIDDFYYEGGREIRQDTLDMELKTRLDAAVSIDLKKIVRESLVATRIAMSEDEITEFVDKTIAKKLNLNIENGIARLYYDLRSKKG